ncbi:MAG TPA: secondary thiamine-phosphate synthase enzyme YjbQ [Candidatus Methanoperedens sp.]
MKKLMHSSNSFINGKVRIMDIQTTTQTELIDITDRVRAAVRESGVKDGICVISTRHSTGSIIINENERGLRNDILEMLENLIPENKSYAHNQIDNNAHAHLRAVLLGMSEIVPVEDGHLVLGTWQSIFFVELDGPRKRSVNIKILES